MRYLFFIALSFFLLNCKNDVKQDVSEENETAQHIIDKSIEVSGGEVIYNSKIEFDFRDVNYKAIRNDGTFSLTRITVDGNTRIVDSLSNDGFDRKVNDEIIEIPDSMALKYSASVNSVHYFSMLPFGLNDEAVQKELLPPVTINDKDYQTIKVTFKEDGGGEDFEDVFFYWIDKKTNKLAYLAYSFAEEDGMGLRFREAFNERFVNGVRFVDYNNYKPMDKSIKLTDLPEYFNDDKLELLSKIELKNISVTPI
ncbi:DUF6503 family protein [Psychroserpens sp. Hel_I_66]|uniref:DUF6503 family protein n=1 Tax=Psychroserpens sp. Hel_I_66 TaxID=1250004 RepID=UPI000647939B|nr:DUF6503 family protein [Psychroserpens sp. Hel_I_66]